MTATTRKQQTATTAEVHYAAIAGYEAGLPSEGRRGYPADYGLRCAAAFVAERFTVPAMREVARALDLDHRGNADDLSMRLARHAVEADAAEAAASLAEPAQPVAAAIDHEGLVAEINGVGTVYSIYLAIGLLPSGDYHVYVSSGPATAAVAEGLTWAQAMDTVRDAVAEEIADNA